MDGNATRDAGAGAAEDAAAAALGVALTALSAVGLLLNTYLLVVIVLTKQPSSASVVLLLHLGAVGALASGAALGARADGTGVGCVARGYLLAALHPLQLWTVCGLHADRCAAIAAPLHYAALVSPRKALMCLGCGWAVTLALLAPLATSHPPLHYSGALASCAPACDAGPVALAYCLAYTALTLLLPAALVLLCTLKVLRIARYHRHRIAAAIYEVTLSAQVTVTHQRNPFAIPPPRRRRRSALASALQPLCSLVLLYFPYYGVLIGRAAAAPPAPLAAAAVALLAAAPPANVVLYGLRSRALRTSLRNYWRKRLTKSEVTQEIQARTPSACGSRRPSLSGGSSGSRAPPPRRLSDAAAFAGRRADLERPTPRAASCNTLRGALDELDPPPPAAPPAPPRACAIPVLRAPPHVLLGRALGLDEARRAAAAGRRRRSPRITVTRAMSDESESPVRAPLCRQQSRSSGTLACGGGGGVSPASSGEVAAVAAPAGCGEEQLLLSWAPSACGNRAA